MSIESAVSIWAWSGGQGGTGGIYTGWASATYHFTPNGPISLTWPYMGQTTTGAGSGTVTLADMAVTLSGQAPANEAPVLNVGSGAQVTLAGSQTFAGINVLPGGTLTTDYDTSGGTLTVTGPVVVDGTFTQPGGTHQFPSLTIGTQAGTTGVYQMNGGNLNVAGCIEVGGGGTGQFTHTAGTVTVGDTLRIGYRVDPVTSAAIPGAGTYTLSGGTLTTAANASSSWSGTSILALAGATGNPTFIQTGGTHTVEGTLEIGTDPASSYHAEYRMPAGGNGALDVWGPLMVAGTFTHTSGTVTAESGLLVGYRMDPDTGEQYPGAGGTYTLNGAGATLNTYSTVIASLPGGGPASFTQTGGLHSVWGGVFLEGESPTAQASYTMSGGQLNALGIADCAGTFTQTGGAVAASGTLSVRNRGTDMDTGASFGGPGLYTLNGADATLSDGYTWIWAFAGYGDATFEQLAGTHTVGASGLRILEPSTHDHATYHLAGGTLSITGGVYNTGTLNVSGGTLSATGTMTNYYHYIQSAGNVAIGTVNNNSSIQITGGTATFGPVTGNGSDTIEVGGGSGAATVTASYLRNTNLTLHNNGILTLAAGATPNLTPTILQTLTIDHTPGSGGNPGTYYGTLDITNHDLAVAYGANDGGATLAAIADMVRAAQAATPHWGGDGVRGLTSSSVAAHYSGTYPDPGPAARGLGVFDNNRGDNTPFFTDGTLDGVSLGATAQDQANHVIVKYLFLGDLNADGLVNGADYNVIDGAMVRIQNGENLPAIWQNGDLNYDGAINGTDYNVIDHAEMQWVISGWNVSGPPTNPPAPSPAPAPVPEPGTIALLLLGVVAVVAPLRRR